MTNIFRLSAILMIVTIVAGFVLAKIYMVTKPQIELQKMAKTEEALRIVMPDAKLIVAVERKVPVKDNRGNVLYEKSVVEYYRAYASEDTTQLIGIAFKALGNGYSSIIETMVGVEPFGKIGKIKIISQKETPGLGANCVNGGPFDGKKWTTEQFVGKTLSDLKVDKDGGPIVSITGSTITSRAVTNSIREKLKILMPVLEKLRTEKMEAE